MIATIVNCVSVMFGSMLGIMLHKRISDSYKLIVYIGAGMVSLVLGIKMSLESSHIVFLALSLIIGGIVGEWWAVEDRILGLGNILKKRFTKAESGKDFAYGFLNASVLFCVGAMTLVGAFKAGTEGDYELLLTKSVMDGFMSIVLTAAMGIGVAFSSLTILIYQGGLTLVSTWLKPIVTEIMIQELTAIGGVLVIMIGINLLNLAKIKTANFLPSFVLIVIFMIIEPFFPWG